MDAKSLSLYDPYIGEGIVKSLIFKLLKDMNCLLKEVGMVSLHCSLAKNNGNISFRILQKDEENSIRANTRKEKFLAILII